MVRRRRQGAGAAEGDGSCATPAGRACGIGCDGNCARERARRDGGGTRLKKCGRGVGGQRRGNSPGARDGPMASPACSA